MDEGKLVWMSRAEYEAKYGVIPTPGTIGANFYGPDAKTIVFQIRFYEEEQEVDFLEELATR